MKISLAATLLLAGLAGTGPAWSADMQGMDMNSMPLQGTKAGQPHHAVGTVKKIDAAKGRITIAHEPVNSLNWPAMTMPFKITQSQAAAIRPGQRVDFEFITKGTDAVITKISPAN
jgi:Cu(I)/Ag(I) efflux system protein CusF